ncbi:MAG: hypothetical protein HQL51_10510 [Magnetococcales bacterium]|nr:hypothetical protein [Magnetococcales bacterium]
MDLERDVDDFLGIDPDAPDDESPGNESPAPKVAKVDEEEDLGDDSKEDPHLKEKPRQRVSDGDEPEPQMRHAVAREGDPPPKENFHEEWIRDEREATNPNRKPQYENALFSNRDDEGKQTPPKSDSGPERQEASDHGKSRDESWGAWNAQGTGVSLKDEPVAPLRKEAEQWLEEQAKEAGRIPPGSQVVAANETGVASDAASRVTNGKYSIPLSDKNRDDLVKSARNWHGTPYASAGGNSKRLEEADCAGANAGIYKDAGLPYQHRQAEFFGQDPHWVKLPNGEHPKKGDAIQLRWYKPNGKAVWHIVMVDPEAGKDEGHDIHHAGSKGYGSASLADVIKKSKMEIMGAYSYRKEARDGEK